MDTEFLPLPSAPDASIGPIGPILPSETLSKPPIPPLKPIKKPPVSKKHKRILSEVMTEISCVKDVKFDALHVPHVPVQLRLPTNFDTDDPYAPFSLFWPENMWMTITRNTNIYTVQKRLDLAIEKQYPWHDTCEAEIKIFFGILIYMGLHKEYEEAQY